MKSKDKVAVQSSGSGGKQQLNIFYRPPVNGGNLWELSKEPHTKFLTQSPIVNLGSSTDCASCVMAGTEILMADGTTRAIETFVGGEIVKTMIGTSKVISLDRIRLGVTRRIIEMRVGSRAPLFISDEHAMWTRFQDADGKPYEWWGVYNYNHYLVEKISGAGVRLNRDAIPLRFDIPQTHAHIEGWRHVQPIYHVLHPDTEIFHLIVEEGSSYIAGGFVISSHAADKDGENFNWHGTSENEAASQFVESLTA